MIGDWKIKVLSQNLGMMWSVWIMFITLHYIWWLVPLSLSNSCWVFYSFPLFLKYILNFRNWIHTVHLIYFTAKKKYGEKKNFVTPFFRHINFRCIYTKNKPCIGCVWCTWKCVHFSCSYGLLCGRCRLIKRAQ